MARPKKPNDDVRANVLRIRLTDEERRALDEAAKSRELETSTWARSELLLLAKKLRKALIWLLRATRPPPGLGYRLPDPASYCLGCQCL